MSRILILAEDGEVSACTRYRALQHAERLAARLGRVDVLLPHDVPHPRATVASRAAFFARGAAGYASTAVRLGRALHDYDAVFVQRGLYSMGPGAIVGALERYRGRVVFDLDDAVFLPSPALAGRSAVARWLYGPQQALRLLRRADAVIVSTPTLAEQLSRVRPPDAVLPTVPDPAAYPLAEHDGRSGPVTLGWVGQIRNIAYLDPLAHTIGQLTREQVAELVVVSAAAWDGPSRFRPWTLAEEASVFADLGIGLMPLPDTPYTRAKAGFKLLQYMAAGVPFVASPVGVNRDLAERSQAGILATSAGEWDAAIRTLAGDAGMRAELGARGRRFIDEYADLERQADTLAALLRS